MLSFTYTKGETKGAVHKYRETDFPIFEAITRNDHLAVIGMAIDLYNSINHEISVGSYKWILSDEYNTPLSYALALLKLKGISVQVVEALLHVGANANDERVLALICAPGQSSDPSWIRAQKLICDDVPAHTLGSILQSTRNAFDCAQDSKWGALTDLVLTKSLFLNYSRKRRTILNMTLSSFGENHILTRKLRSLGALTYAELQPKLELSDNTSLLPMYYARRKDGYEALPMTFEPLPPTAPMSEFTRMKI